MCCRSGARTKQTACKQPGSGIQQPTGGPTGQCQAQVHLQAVVTSGGRPQKPAKLAVFGGKAPQHDLIRGHHYIPYDQTMVAKLARENHRCRLGIANESESRLLCVLPNL